MTKSQQLQGRITVSHVQCPGPKDHQKSSDLSRRRKSCSDVDDRTSSGRLFQTAGVAAAKALLPIV